MDQFDDWLQRVSAGKIDGTLQSEIADKILELLEQKKASVSTRDKELFAQAVIGLSINVNSIYHPTEPDKKGLLMCENMWQYITTPGVCTRHSAT